MRSICVAGCCIALASSAVLLGCSHEESQPPPQAVAAPPQPREPGVAERARALLLAADLEVRDLQDIRSHAADDDRREAVSRQIATIAVSRDRLTADLAVSPDSVIVERDMRGLQRAMHGSAATMTQPELPPAPAEPAPER